MLDQSLIYYIGASLVVAGFVYASFSLAEANINSQFRAKIKGCLENGELNIVYFGEVFAAVFTPKHRSFACIFRSCVASIVGLFIVSFVALCLSVESSTLYDQSIFTLSSQIFLIGLGLNLIPDYFSLWETRWVLKKMDGTHGIKQALWVLFDLGASLAIFLLPITLIIIFPENRLTAPLWNFMGVYEELFSQADSSIHTLNKISLFFDSLRTPDKASFLLVFICTFTTILTSVWIWIYFIAGLLFKFLSVLNVSEKPLQSVGYVSSGFVLFTALILSPFILGKSTKMEMVKIPGGTFKMGCVSGLNCLEDEMPVHTVRVGPFEMAKYEVTFDQYFKFTKALGKKLPDDGGWGRGARPVINVSWDDAQAYIAWMNENLTAMEIKQSGRFRLPTEAEWEYAARVGSRGRETSYSWGNKIGVANANCGDSGSLWSDRQTAPVGSFKANYWGLHDMHGNVTEWVEDHYHNNYNGAPDDGSAWVSDSGMFFRVLRGGGWNSSAQFCRSAYRYQIPRGYAFLNFGLRVSRGRPAAEP